MHSLGRSWVGGIMWDRRRTVIMGNKIKAWQKQSQKNGGSEGEVEGAGQ